MTTEQVWLGATCAVATAVALVSLVVALRARRRAVRAESLAASLAEHIGASRPPAGATPDGASPDDRGVLDHADNAYVITRMDSGEEPEQAVPFARAIDGRLFTDIVAREAVVKAASWTAGLRRALSASNRNRIRFEVRQEIRRTGRERRAETKQALREFRERERSGSSPGEVREDVA